MDPREEQLVRHWHELKLSSPNPDIQEEKLTSTSVLGRVLYQDWACSQRDSTVFNLEIIEAGGKLEHRFQFFCLFQRLWETGCEFFSLSNKTVFLKNGFWDISQKNIRKIERLNKPCAFLRLCSRASTLGSRGRIPDGKCDWLVLWPPAFLHFKEICSYKVTIIIKARTEAMLKAQICHNTR